MHIKTAKKYHLTPIRMTIIKKCTNNKFWRRYGEKATLFALLVGMQTDIAIMENSKEITLKIRNKSYFCAKLPFSLIMRYVKLIIPSNPTTGHKQWKSHNSKKKKKKKTTTKKKQQKQQKKNQKQKKHPNVGCNNIYNNQDMEAT